MSVVIKEMEMPEYCLDCYFAERYPHDNYASIFCHITSEDVSKCARGRMRGNDCPLVEVEIIRCKDCVHCRKGFNLENEPYYYCYEWDSGVEEDGFCSDAERRTDE